MILLTILIIEAIVAHWDRRLNVNVMVSVSPHLHNIIFTFPRSCKAYRCFKLSQSTNNISKLRHKMWNGVF